MLTSVVMVTVVMRRMIRADYVDGGEGEYGDGTRKGIRTAIRSRVWCIGCVEYIYINQQLNIG